MTSFVLVILGLIQIACAIPIVQRLLRVRRSRRVPRVTSQEEFDVSLIIPVLNEEARLRSTLASVAALAANVREILVVDGGSTDGTVRIIKEAMGEIPKLRFVDASPVPQSAVGKAWNLLQGTKVARGRWVLNVDADTVFAPDLVASLVTFAEGNDLDLLSIAAAQVVEGRAQSVLHPSFLTTLVYRFGPPGHKARTIDDVMANGQCCLASREALQSSNALEGALMSLCEDITIARIVHTAGFQTGFYEADTPVKTTMYGSAQELWNNWPRSLIMRDQFFTNRTRRVYLELILAQALPIWLLIAATLFNLGIVFTAIQVSLVSLRVGVLIGTQSAYVHKHPAFWLSPFADVLTLSRLIEFTTRREFTWRNRRYHMVAPGKFKSVDQ